MSSILACLLFLFMATMAFLRPQLTEPLSTWIATHASSLPLYEKIDTLIFALVFAICISFVPFLAFQSFQYFKWSIIIYILIFVSIAIGYGIARLGWPIGYNMHEGLIRLYFSGLPTLMLLGLIYLQKKANTQA
ncbi:MAG: hypothetical protein JJT94_16040 [Bernardetiaceae bacterium]|nr:hypothetical protein [Bernardetiaceae bacterium]